jgi:hypothetical protein
LVWNADERQTSIWKQRFFCGYWRFDKLESELNEIKGTKVLVRRALVLKCCLGFQICLADNNTKEVNTKSDSNVGTATSDIIGGKSSTWDGIDVPTKFRQQRFYKLQRPRKKA